MSTFIDFVKKYRFIILSMVLVFSTVAAIELYNGRSPLGPDGKFGWWDGDVWSSENSQRVADAYSFSHIIHGLLFYAFLWLIARRLPLKYRFLAALIIEAGWELLENSPLIINRYREVTISLGYVGDSVLNSVCDVGMVAIGFVIARYSKVWFSILLIIILEVGCLFWVRDNLTLNVLMLVHPVESVKLWQSEGHDVKTLPYNINGESLKVFGEPVYGDLDKDGDNDAAVWLVSNTPGSGTFYYAGLAIKDGNIYKATKTMLLGDRIAPQTLEIKEGRAVYNFAERRADEPMTTPPSIGKSVWVHYDAKTNEIGEFVKGFEGESAK